jgi:hypothetical protein
LVGSSTGKSGLVLTVTIKSQLSFEAILATGTDSAALEVGEPFASRPGLTDVVVKNSPEPSATTNAAPVPDDVLPLVALDGAVEFAICVLIVDVFAN